MRRLIIFLILFTLCLPYSLAMKVISPYGTGVQGGGGSGVGGNWSCTETLACTGYDYNDLINTPIIVNGTDGINGTNGSTGPQGPTGPQGNPGVDGINGTNGTNGLNGTNGINGLNGGIKLNTLVTMANYSLNFTWNDTSEFLTGNVRGATGAQGPQGNPGQDGLNGTNGIDGLNGTNGVDGVDGVNGTNGTNGVNGLNGGIRVTSIVQLPNLTANISFNDSTSFMANFTGLKGLDGAPGANGLNGTNGSNGSVGPQGPQGIPGVDGMNGTNGTNGLNGTGQNYTHLSNFTNDVGFIGFANLTSYITSTNTSWVNTLIDARVTQAFVKALGFTTTVDLNNETIVRNSTLNLSISESTIVRNNTLNASINAKLVTLNGTLNADFLDSKDSSAFMQTAGQANCTSTDKYSFTYPNGTLGCTSDVSGAASPITGDFIYTYNESGVMRFNETKQNTTLKPYIASSSGLDNSTIIRAINQANCTGTEKFSIIYSNGTLGCTTDQTGVGGGSVNGTDINVSKVISDGPIYSSNFRTVGSNTTEVFFDDMNFAPAAYNRITTAPVLNTNDPNSPSSINFASAASAGGDGGLVLSGGTATNLAIMNATKLNYFETRAKLRGTTQRADLIGVFKTATTVVSNSSKTGVFFFYNATVGGSNWIAHAENNGVSTKRDTNIPGDTNYHTFTIVGNNRNGGESTAYEFFIDNTSRANISTNLPTTKVSTLGTWVESNDAVADTLTVDYIYYEMGR